MGWREDDYYFERTEALAREAMKEGDDGFACVHNSESAAYFSVIPNC